MVRQLGVSLKDTKGFYIPNIKDENENYISRYRVFEKEY